jgi:DNA-binding transcriptional MerR regulator
MTLQRYDIILHRRDAQQLSLDALAARAGMHPVLVEHFVECGLLEPTGREGTAVFFDVSAVPRLRMIGRLRESLGINVAGIAVVLDLLDRFRTVQRENEMLRNRL